MITLNYSKLTLYITEQANKLNRRNITPLGKIAIIKSLFPAKINYWVSAISNFKEI